MRISHSSAHRILVKYLGLFPYKLHCRQRTRTVERGQRLDRCRAMKERLANGGHRKVIWSDEKIFTVEQAHNKQNDRLC
uniref:Transposase n=1 Tax=Ditylenchus dipsaci TaxID=166011 RepID=A0A915DUY3_9BILA